RYAIGAEIRSRVPAMPSRIQLARVAVGAALAGLGGLDLAVLRRSRGLEGVDEPAGRLGDLGDRALERIDVLAARLARTADLADVLQGRGVDLVVGRGRLEVEQRADVAAHGRKHSPRRRARDRDRARPAR